MNSVVVLLLGIAVMYIGLRFYGRHFDRNVIGADPKRATPARMYADGVDFIPTSRNVLFGFQFKSIAGAAPILGPVIAMKWGWLPGLLWILLGTFFIGWIHDYTSAIVSLRNDGKTFGGISYELITPRARTILLTFVYFYLLLVAAAFGNVVAGTLTKPVLPIPTLMLTVGGVVTGLMLYRGRMGLVPTTIVGLVLFGIGVALASPLQIGGSKLIWLFFTLGFCYLGSVLPIWSFTQPINYIGFYIIFIGILGAVLGTFVGHPTFAMPAFEMVSGQPLWPLLFVTIACGAISGWHSIVSSTGTSRQLERETDALPVSGGAMFLEMLLALVALIAAGATVKGPEEFRALLAEGPGKVFFTGFSKLLGYIGVPESFGTIFGGIFLIVLAITILQLVIRFMRIASNELIGSRLPLIRNPHVGTVLALILTFFFVWTGTFQYIWVLFGSANQLMASLALLIGALWLVSQRKNSLYLSVPMVFMYVTTMAALIYTDISIFRKISAGGLSPKDAVGNWSAAIIAIVLFVAALVLMYDGVRAFGRVRRASGG